MILSENFPKTSKHNRNAADFCQQLQLLHQQCLQMWGFILKVGIFQGKVGIDFFEWGLKFKVRFDILTKKCKFF